MILVMTRINLIDPKQLYDQHLMAEYRELPMVGSSLVRSLKSKNWSMEKIPSKFTLNKGHVTFFYDKGLYLSKRYDLLRIELKKRGFNLDDTRIFKREQWPDYLYNDWTPTESDLMIVKQRIWERLISKPHFYRKTLYVKE